MNDDTTQSWLKFLNPSELKQNLIRCSIFITAWEILKESIVDPILWFYTDGIRGKKYVRPRYHQEVIELDTGDKKDTVHASCMWLRKNGVIGDADIKIISNIREHRNFVVHEMNKVLASTRVQVNLGLLDNLIDILGKIDLWWITEVEIPTNPDIAAADYDKIDMDRTFSMRMKVLQLIAKVAYDDDQALAELYEDFKKRTGSIKQDNAGD